MVCEMVIDGSGQVTDSSFYEAVIHSHARLTYTQVGQVLEEGYSDDVASERYEGLIRLHELYKVLRAARSKRGAIDFETVETRIIFDENRKKYKKQATQYTPPLAQPLLRSRRLNALHKQFNMEEELQVTTCVRASFIPFH